MTENKLHVAVIFGGHFGEHEVSLMSARSVLAALDPAKYEVIQTGIKHECIRQYAVRACEAIDCAGMDGLIELAMERKADRDHTSHIYWSET